MVAIAGVPFADVIIRVTVSGRDLSSVWRPVVISLSVDDKAGRTSDTCRILLDDTGGQIPTPQKSEPLKVGLGRRGAGIADVFDGFVADARSLGDRGGGQTMLITGSGVDQRSAAKEPRQKHWDDKPLGEVMTDVAGLAGLDGIAVHESLAGIVRDWWAMDGESPIAFGRRIAAELGATWKIVGTRGVMVPRSAGVSASGLALTPITVARPGNLISWDISPINARPAYRDVIGRWYDPDEARWKESRATIEGADAASGGQALAFPAADEDGADAAARSEAGESARDRGGGRVVIDGDPRPRPEAPCTVSGTRGDVDGTWTIDGVGHALDRGQGWITTLDLVRPGGSGGGG